MMSHLPKKQLAVVLFVSAVAQSLAATTAADERHQGPTRRPAEEQESTKSSPKDTTPYLRPALPEDYAVGEEALRKLISPKVISPFPSVFMVDVVVNNTNANLTNTDMRNDGEPSIAVNPLNPGEILIHSDFGGWTGNADVWHSTDAGVTWTQEFSVPSPPGAGGAAGCPCDTAIDYGRGDRFSGTFLSFSPTNVYTGTTTNPASAAAWNWLLDGSGNAVRTNSTGVGNSDQPWLLVNRDPTTSSQDNLYVAYDDFTGGPDMRVAVAQGTNPPNFTIDNQSGTSTAGVNPGHRLAVDPVSGSVYSLFQRNVAAGAGGSKNIDFMLNRSTDGGATWTLNGAAGGIIVANADSTQPTPKFGTVNALLGGVLHAAVDPTSGDVYYVYGNRDSGTGNDRLAIRRVQDNGMGGVTVGAQVFVTGQVEAALPSVAVAGNGIIGVFYYTFDGLSVPDNIPTFSAHLSLSDDHAQTFTDQVLLTFLSSATDNSNSRQRVLGDYVQMKAVGDTLFGTFTANGVSFGRPFANHDPIFFSVSVNRPPVALCQNVTASTTPGLCTAPANVDNGSFDPDVDNTITLLQSPPSPYSLGATAVTLTVTDNNGAQDMCTAIVTVEDHEKPSVTCPAPITVECTGPAGAPATFSASGADNCPGVTTACVPPSGSTFPLGTTAISCAATDGSGNVSSACASSVTVVDAMPPIITNVSANPNVLWPPNHRMRPVAVAVSVTDVCDPNVACHLISVTSNEPVNGPGDGNTSPDWQITGPLTANLRSERAGGGSGRVYTLTVQCTDASHNSATGAVNVFVPHDQGHD
jgi:hypothetical protein